MVIFQPERDVANSALILDTDGSWPNFHDAEMHSLNLWRGDMRPDDNVWIGPVIDTTLELTALMEPFIVMLRFHDCDAIEMSGFNHDNMIFALNFGLEDRGFYADNRTPLPPYITVEFQRSFGVALKFRCFRIEVVERKKIDPAKYA